MGEEQNALFRFFGFCVRGRELFLVWCIHFFVWRKAARYMNFCIDVHSSECPINRFDHVRNFRIFLESKMSLNKAKIVPIHQRNIAFLWKVFKTSHDCFLYLFCGRHPETSLTHILVSNIKDIYIYAYIHKRGLYIYIHNIHIYFIFNVFFWSDLSIDPVATFQPVGFASFSSRDLWSATRAWGGCYLMQLFDERLRKIHQASLIFCCVCVDVFFCLMGGWRGRKMEICEIYRWISSVAEVGNEWNDRWSRAFSHFQQMGLVKMKLSLVSYNTATWKTKGVTCFWW